MISPPFLSAPVGVRLPSFTQYCLLFRAFLFVHPVPLFLRFSSSKNLRFLLSLKSRIKITRFTFSASCRAILPLAIFSCIYHRLKRTLSPTSSTSSLNSRSHDHSLGPQLTPQNCCTMNSPLILRLLDKPTMAACQQQADGLLRLPPGLLCAVTPSTSPRRLPVLGPFPQCWLCTVLSLGPLSASCDRPFFSGHT